ncbi:hypothetical protein M427DRAFT_41495 [Gonapodya prolifera JEL478]|uniref:Uncharacterized protein n=1 Tax=Gonapodya prolifera (strain JEL478) TaxID=1344416 RepID=A0A139ATZ7_GONPJ|nr:hypothetical protein M427DRAFT_41495 [Gonapodya prolifera JEL478]|eukprot:KXS20201.1 hypothetical protein M427DRAFT_41495 [Gonapodya prolifera JEL478]
MAASKPLIPQPSFKGTAESLSRSQSTAALDNQNRNSALTITLWSLAALLGVVVGSIALVALVASSSPSTHQNHSLAKRDEASAVDLNALPLIPILPSTANVNAFSPGIVIPTDEIQDAPLQLLRRALNSKALPIGDPDAVDPRIPPFSPGPETPEHQPISILPVPGPNKPSTIPPPFGLPRPAHGHGPHVFLNGLHAFLGKGIHIPEPVVEPPLPISDPEPSPSAPLDSAPGPKLPDQGRGPISILPVPATNPSTGQPIPEVPPPLGVPGDDPPKREHGNIDNHSNLINKPDTLENANAQASSDGEVHVPEDAPQKHRRPLFHILPLNGHTKGAVEVPEPELRHPHNGALNV